MKSQPLQPSILAARNSQNRRWQWLGLIGLAAALALVVYGAAVRAPQAPAQPLLIQAAALDPAAQSVAAYLRAHASVAPAVAIDPAAQSVNAYLRAHASVTPAPALDPAAQSVNAYLRLHSK